jgi:RNA polymerase sigma-70 factor (ECF subfamily)
MRLVASPTPAAVDAVDADDDLVTRARQGDRAAYGRLFERHHGRIHGMCARLLRKGDDVDDAVQQTFLEGWRCLHRFEGKSRFTTWLTRIAIHTCFSTRRRLKRLLLIDIPDDDENRASLSVVSGAISNPLFDTGPLPADEVASRRARERALSDVLAQLSEKKRVVFVLVDLEGMTSPEAADILGINEATIRTRLFYARQEVAAALRNHPGFADLERVHR